MTNHDDIYDDDDFCEEDEPVEKLIAAFAKGEKVITALPPSTIEVMTSEVSVTESTIGARRDPWVSVAENAGVKIS